MATGKRTRSTRKASSTLDSSGTQISTSNSTADDATESAVLRASFDPTPFEDATNTDDSTDVTSDGADTPKAVFVGEQIVFKDRDSRIAEAAYRRAQDRGFTPGYELDDWLAAEKEIDALLASDGNNVR
jgi:Protein of unknown function (DUF2934)